MDHSLTLALWSLGRLKSEELPVIASTWLAGGLDSPSLRQLAGEASPIMSDVAPLFERSLAELELRAPGKEEALHRLARYYAERIINGTMSPHEGAGMIWWEVTNQLDTPSPLFLSFVGAASELDEIPDILEDGADRREYVRELETSIVANARKLLEEEPNQPVTQRSGADAPPRG